jgi:hypothetical protein
MVDWFAYDWGGTVRLSVGQLGQSCSLNAGLLCPSRVFLKGPEGEQLDMSALGLLMDVNQR